MKFIFGHVEAHGRPSVGWGRARERGSEKNAARCGKGGSWVSAAEPIKTSTAHYFACFSFDNNAESDPDPDPKKTDSKASAELVLSLDFFASSPARRGRGNNLRAMLKFNKRNISGHDHYLANGAHNKHIK